MTKRAIFSLLSRVVFLLIGAGVVGAAYTFIRIVLAPVAVPPAPPASHAVTFDPKLDVTKNEIFGRLRSVGPSAIEVGKLGRENPFIPVPTSSAEQASATTTISTATTTVIELRGESSTGTLPRLFSTTTR